MTDVDALLANAQHPEATVEIYLGPPELAHERQQLVDLAQERRRLTAKKDRTSDEKARLAQLQARATADQDRLDALVPLLSQHVLKTRVRAIPHREWSTLIIEHPPREGVEADRRKGVNTSTFWAIVVPRSLPDLTRDQYDKLDAIISEGEWLKVCNLVEVVNVGITSVPKLPDGLPTSPSSDGTSKQPNASASA